MARTQSQLDLPASQAGRARCSTASAKRSPTPTALDPSACLLRLSPFAKTIASFGTYQYQHVAARLLFGYSRVEVAYRQFAFVASPEKALLDLVHLTPGGDATDYLSELRLQSRDALSAARLAELSRRSGKPKWARAARRIDALWAAEPEESL